MHVAKYNKSATGHLCAHYERRKNDKGEYVRFGNQDIDLSRTHLNYNLAPERDQIEYIQQRTSEVKCQKRADVNVMCDWVVTVPKELDPKYHKYFFKASYDFLEQKYGKENVISAYVHMDETTPHMHFAFVPVVYDEKKEIHKVSAKQLLTKTELKRMHPELTRHIQSYSWGKDINLINGATVNGNRSIEEMKLERLQKATKYYQKQKDSREEEFNQVSKEVRHLKDERVHIKAELELLQEQIEDKQSQLKDINEVQLPQAREELISAQISSKKAQEELDIIKTKVVSILNSASETFKKIIKLNTQLPEEKAIEFVEQNRLLHNEKIEQLEVHPQIKEKGKGIIDAAAEEVKEYIRPRRRGR